MNIQTGCFITAVLLIAKASVPSLAGDFPKSGEAEYDTYYVFKNLAKIESGGTVGALDEITGITRNVKGEGPFHDMSVRCLMHWTMISEKWNGYGSCVETDKDGDEVFTTFDGEAHYLVGGTGKYKGITGKAPYTYNGLHATVDGREAAIVTHKVSWEIK